MELNLSFPIDLASNNGFDVTSIYSKGIYIKPHYILNEAYVTFVFFKRSNDFNSINTFTTCVTDMLSSNLKVKLDNGKPLAIYKEIYTLYIWLEDTQN